MSDRAMPFGLAVLGAVPKRRLGRPAARRRTLLGAWLLAAALALIMALHLGSASTAIRSAASQRSLASALRADGTLNGVQGSFDARGYRMVLGRGGAPRFVRVGAGIGAGATAGFAAFGAGPAMAAAGDNYWSDRFGMVGIAGGGTIFSVAVSGSNIYVGGKFTSLGSDNGIAANDVAMWNGHGWFPLGNGIGPSTQTVYALAVVGGKLYAGGNFTTAGSLSVAHLAMWNGSTWADVGGGVTNGTTGQVNALAASGSTLYVGGSFNKAGTTTGANSIAAWNTTTSTWSTLGSGILSCFFSGGNCTSSSIGTVDALAVSGSTLYAGGNFTAAGGQEIEDLAAWNGSAWSAVGGNAIRSGSSLGTAVDALAANPAAHTLYIGGAFDHVGGTVSNGTVTNAGVGANAVAEWNGTSWAPLASGADGCCATVNALAYRNSRLYMAGNFPGAGGDGVPNIAQWDGTAWTGIGAGLPSYPQALLATSAGVIAGGHFATTTDSSVLMNGVGLWTGSAWQGYGLGVSNGSYGGSLNAIATLGSSLYAVGNAADSGWTSTNLQGIAQFNNTRWLSVGGGVGATTVNAVAVYGKYLFVGGQFSFTASNGTATNLAVWDGSVWHAIGSGPGGAIAALLPFDGKLWMAGPFGAGCGTCTYHQLATWKLSNLTSGDYTQDGYSTVGGNALYNGNIYALAGYTASSTAHYVVIGGSFQSLTDQTHITGNVNSLVSYHVENTSTSSYTDGYLFFPGANGTFGVTTGTAVGQVNALLVDGPNLYVGGSFGAAGAEGATGFAHCYLPNQTTAGGCWQTSPGPFTSPNTNPPSVNSIVKVESAYYLAGSFASAGGVTAPDIVQYTPGTSTFAALGSGLGAGYSGPSATGLTEGLAGLYVGGHFGLAGGKPSENIGLWTGTAFPTLSEAASAKTDAVGSPVTFTAKITNGSAITWSALTVSETLPSSVSYDSSSISTGGSCAASATTPVKLTCKVSSVPSSATATVAITLTPNSSGALTNAVNLSASGFSFGPSASTTVTVS